MERSAGLFKIGVAVVPARPQRSVLPDEPERPERKSAIKGDAPQWSGFDIRYPPSRELVSECQIQKLH